ncbi:hypothetical protein [Gordonia aichiensis]|uniref:hypothetical protein n=1 Tax=Gordonia aichiensis TaxID=36820 RepID=UPI00326342A9
MSEHHHLYGAHRNNQWVHRIVSGGPTPPDTQTTVTPSGESLRLPYLATFDHEPTEDDLDTYRPAEFAHHD